ncbi:hypothetical protein IAE22_33030, partial [Bacillus sp. S34]|nr:hypothetical protein [Bacillus sp. S34]
MAVELNTRTTRGDLATPTFSTMRFPAGEAHVKVAHDADAEEQQRRDQVDERRGGLHEVEH